MKNSMYFWAKELFPINRSITGKGVRKTLKYIKKKIPKLKIRSIKSGVKCFDWKVPLEWDVTEAHIKDANNKRVLVDFKNNNLHLMGYSSPINRLMNFKDLKKKLHTVPEQPNAIPYRTSYYEKNWGFCLKQSQLKKFKTNGKYYVLINSKLFNGVLNHGEIFIKGKSKKEILFSTNICHPSLANNEISGPVLGIQIAKYLKNKKRKYSYRIIFIPETIGAVVFLKKNLKQLKKNLIAGFVLTCVGDNNNYSKVSSKSGISFADRILEKTFRDKKIKFKNYSYLYRGSDERQYCSPGVDLPVCSFLRTKYGEFKEYHTSNDNLNYISNKGLNNSFKIMKKLISNIENSDFYKTTKYCEPFMTKYNLKRSISGEPKLEKKTKLIIDLIAYCDGQNSLNDISKILNTNLNEIGKIVKILTKLKIIRKL